MLLQVLSSICAASVYVEELTPFCAGGLYAEGKDYCNSECIDPCANLNQAACLISPVPSYCQARTAYLTLTLSYKILIKNHLSNFYMKGNTFQNLNILPGALHTENICLLICGECDISITTSWRCLRRCRSTVHNGTGPSHCLYACVIHDSGCTIWQIWQI
jgi:hypothetical protein